MKIEDIIEAVEDRFTTETLDPGRLERLIAGAVKYYSRYNGYLKSGMLTLVAGQQDYDVAADCALVREVDYWPAGEIFGLLEVGQEEYADLLREERKYRYHFPSDQVIDSIQRSALADRQGIRWEQIGSRKVRLHPAPAAADTIDYEYYAVHTLDVAGDDYTTIPSEDLEIVRDLTLAEILEGRGLEYVVEPDYAEGLQRVTKSRIPSNVETAVARLRRGVQNKYGGGAIADQGSVA